MTTVSRFEADLLRILQALLGWAPMEGVSRLILSRRECPPCLSAGAVRLVEDALALGCARRLAELGGWYPSRHLRSGGGRIASGRLWERSTPEELALRFSSRSMEFLLWLTAEDPCDPKSAWSPPEPSMTDGDRLFLFLAQVALMNSSATVSLPAISGYDRIGLFRLAYPDEFTGNHLGPPRFDPWVEGLGASVLEVLQDWLSTRWVTLERRKGVISDPIRMRTLGLEQERVLNGWLSACERAGRRDLCRFILSAGATLLEVEPSPRAWIGGLRLNPLRVAERAEIYRSAGAFLRSIGRLHRWEREARTVSFLDEGYAASQLWKADWEELGGEAVADRAGAVLKGMDPMALARPT